MKLCILCTVDKIDSVRRRANKVFKHDVLQTKLSENGVYPATHMFCVLDVSERGGETIMRLQKDSIMEFSDKKEFLEKWNLKEIE